MLLSQSETRERCEKTEAQIARLHCLLTRHDLVVYRTYTLRLECRRCRDPWSDTLADKLQRWSRQRKLPKTKPTDDGLPF